MTGAEVPRVGKGAAFVFQALERRRASEFKKGRGCAPAAVEATGRLG